jgi:ribosome maturation factor RimP
MDRQALVDELKNIIGDYLKEKGLDLVDLTYRYEGRGLVLRILVDKPEGGISLDGCACLNNQLSIILDEKDILKERYILEVSSPGLDRPLKTKSDFLRCINRNVRFFLREPISDRLELEGIISDVRDDSVYIDIGKGVVEITLSKIAKAKEILTDI